MESGEQIVVGVNKFTIEEPPAKGLLHIDASVAANQIKKLQEMKAARDNVLVRQRLDALRTAAEGSDNLMPYIPGLRQGVLHRRRNLRRAAQGVRRIPSDGGALR